MIGAQLRIGAQPMIEAQPSPAQLNERKPGILVSSTLRVCKATTSEICTKNYSKISSCLLCPSVIAQ